MIGIETVKPGKTLGDVGFAIQSHAETNGFSVVEILQAMDLVLFFTRLQLYFIMVNLKLG